MLRRQPVRRAEDPYAQLIRQRGAEALCVVKVAAGIAAAVQVQYDSLPALVPRHYPRALKVGKGLVPYYYVFFMYSLHKLTQLVLPLSYRFKRAVGDQRLKEVKLGAYQLCAKAHKRVLSDSVKCASGNTIYNMCGKMLLYHTPPPI